MGKFITPVEARRTVLVGVAPVADRIVNVVLLRIRRQRIQCLDQSVQGVVGVMMRAVSDSLRTKQFSDPKFASLFVVR